MISLNSSTDDKRSVRVLRSSMIPLTKESSFDRAANIWTDASMANFSVLSIAVIQMRLVLVIHRLKRKGRTKNDKERHTKEGLY